MRTVFVLVRKEFLQIFRDRATVVQIFLIPVIQLLVLSNAATFDVKRTRLAVVDEDRTTTAAALVQRLEGGGRFRVVRVSPTSHDVERLLLDREAGAVLTIPRGFDARLVRGEPSPVQLQINAEEGAVAGIVQGSVTAVVADFARDLPPPVVMVRPPARGAPLELRAQGWFNPSRNYKHYMVPAILVSLITILGLLLTAQNIAREKELGTLEQLNVTPITKGAFIAAKLIPFWILSFVLFSVGLTLARLVFGVPMRGSLLLVFGALALYLVVVLGIGLWVSTFTATQQQTMFVAFFILLIFLLMSGLFTPIDAMPDWAQAAAELNPVKHFVVIMRAILVRGAGAGELLRPLGTLAVGGVVILTLAIRQYSKQTR